LFNLLVKVKNLDLDSTRSFDKNWAGENFGIYW